jgi:hypothetical protein
MAVQLPSPESVPLVTPQASGGVPSFGGAEQATQGLAAAASGLGEGLKNQADFYQNILNENTARDAAGALNAKMADIWSKYSQTTGQAAVAGQAEYTAQLQAARKDAIASMPNIVTQEMLGQQAEFMTNRLQIAGGSHAGEQGRAWTIQSHLGNIESAANLAAQNWTNPDFVGGQLGNALNSSRDVSAINGADPDTTKANAALVADKVLLPTILTAGASNPAAAQALLARYGSQLSAAGLERATRELAGKINTQADDSYVNGLFGGASHANPSPASNAGNPQAGGALGMKQNNPLNLEYRSDQPGVQPTAGNRFGTYPDMATGIAANVRQLVINQDQHGIDTVRGQVTQWVNDPKADLTSYIADVSKAIGVGPDDQIDVHNPVVAAAFMRSAQPHESGPGALSGEDISKGVAQGLQSVAATQPGATTPVYPDMSALIQKAWTDTEGMPPERRQQIMAKVEQRGSLIRMATETDRRDLTNSLPDVQAALLGGQDVDTVALEPRIQRLLPPADAAKAIESIDVAKQAGQLFKAAQWQTPEQVAAIRQDLTSGMGPVSAMIGAKGQPTAPAGTAQPGSDAASPEAYRLRMTILGRFNEQMARRDAMLHGPAADPAGYVQAAPTVAAASQAYQAASAQAQASPNDPTAAKAASDALQGYVTASQAVQTSLGVPDAQQHILTRTAAEAQAQKLTSIDPSKGDMGQALAQVAQQYGPAWSKAFGDLVTLGKLSPDYQVLAAMPDPAARTDFQRALAATAAKGGVAQLKEDVPPAAVKDIDNGLDDKLVDFRRTAAVPGLSANVALTATVRDSIKTLAYFYAMQDGDGPKALDRAYNAVIGDKYDFDGTMRVPKGTLATAETVTANVQAALKPADLMPLAADTMATASGPGMTVAQRQAVTLEAARRGAWVPNESDSGLVLVGKLANGGMVQMRRTDGSRIEVPFKGMAVPSAAPMDPGSVAAAAGAG